MEAVGSAERRIWRCQGREMRLDINCLQSTIFTVNRETYNCGNAAAGCGGGVVGYPSGVVDRAVWGGRAGKQADQGQLAVYHNISKSS
jgi:hypothetical protein